MKYIVKCHYCGTTYTVDSEEKNVTFMCESCGGQNDMNDVVERIEEIPTEVKEVAEKIVKEDALRKAWKDEEDLTAIKSFDMSMHPASDEYTETSVDYSKLPPEEKKKVRKLYIFFGLFIIANLLLILIQDM